jgi:hypothetical protein
VAPEREGSSPHSQQPANDPYPEPGASIPHSHNHFDPILSSMPRLSSGLFPLGFPTKTLHMYLLLQISIYNFKTYKGQLC